MLSSGLILRERYRIIKQIGSGGSSLVYLAEDVAIGKKWAIKFLRLDEDENKWLAQNEINMMINLDNEMFPRIVDAWQEQSGYYIVSDYVEGVTLDKVIKANQISKRTILKWLGEIAEGLKYLHTCRPSILYLDLKLENIMLKSDGSIKMIDFGIAGRIADKGSLYGTVGYAAPEQYYNCGELLDERTDVFTFGMLMYAVMTGDCPSAKLDDQTEKVKSDRSLSRKVKGIILKCIQADKELRYRNMEEVLNALDALGVRRKGIHQIKLLAAAGVMVIGISGFCAVNMVVAEPVENVKEKMLSEANGHISHGEYTDEGIRIISGYIDSGCLDYETSQKFIYVVAKHYFEKKRNYRDALRYFSELNEEMYEDTSYYIRLCKLQLSFEEDIEAYAECLDDFAKYNRGLGYCSARYENDLMLATLYETLSYGEDESKELECLQNGLSELSYAKSSGLFADDNDEYEAEYCRRLCILYEEQGDAENTCKYGEMALTLIAEDRTDIREDIKARIGVVSNY